VTGEQAAEKRSLKGRRQKAEELDVLVERRVLRS